MATSGGTDTRRDVELKVDARGRRLVVGGLDLSSLVEGGSIEITFGAGEIPVLTVRCPVKNVSARLTGARIRELLDATDDCDTGRKKREDDGD